MYVCLFIRRKSRCVLAVPTKDNPFLQNYLTLKSGLDSFYPSRMEHWRQAAPSHEGKVDWDTSEDRPGFEFAQQTTQAFPFTAWIGRLHGVVPRYTPRYGQWLVVPLRSLAEIHPSLFLVRWLLTPSPTWSMTFQ